jgi:hypothetical protein
MNNENINKMDKEYFIKKYSILHTELNNIEHEIDIYLKNKKDLLCNDYKLEDLKKKVSFVIESLNKTREDERRIFNY